MSLRTLRLTGDQLVERLPDLARLRIQVFRDFPYLYDGDMAYEQTYLGRYLAPEACLITAFDGDQVVGAATGTPMAGEADHVTAPFRARGDDLGALFYFGESVLDRAYRGRGVGVAFFDERERHARSFWRFRRAVFCGVVRPKDHPKRPADYLPLDDFWRRRGYLPIEGATTRFSWRDVGDAAESQKVMQYWGRELT